MRITVKTKDSSVVGGCASEFEQEKIVYKFVVTDPLEAGVSHLLADAKLLIVDIPNVVVKVIRADTSLHPVLVNALAVTGSKHYVLRNQGTTAVVP